MINTNGANFDKQFKHQTAYVRAYSAPGAMHAAFEYYQVLGSIG